MAKRFTDTEIWNDDWWIELPDGYKFFWFYLKDHCDAIGVVRPQIAKFSLFTDFIVEPDRALLLFNEGKVRIKVLPDGKWLIKDFIKFQYGKNIGTKSSMHTTIRKKLIENNLLPNDVDIEPGID